MRATETAHTGRRVHVISKESSGPRISTAVVSLVGFAGLAIGLWSFAALIGGLIAGGGSLGLVKGYFQAVTGL